MKNIFNILIAAVLILFLACDDFDKYGRLLIDIKLEDMLLSQWLISNNYAFEYDGGKNTSY